MRNTGVKMSSCTSYNEAIFKRYRNWLFNSILLKSVSVPGTRRGKGALAAVRKKPATAGFLTPTYQPKFTSCLNVLQTP
jgi:hypothetical protein